MTAAHGASGGRRRPCAPLAAAAALVLLASGGVAEDPLPFLFPEPNNTGTAVGAAPPPAVSADTDPCPPLPPEAAFTVPPSLHGHAADGSLIITLRGITFAVPGSRNFTWQSLCPVAAKPLGGAPEADAGGGATPAGSNAIQRWAIWGGAYVPVMSCNPTRGQWSWCGEVAVNTGDKFAPAVVLTANVTNTPTTGAWCGWLGAAASSGTPPPPPAGDASLLTVTTGAWVPKRMQSPVDFKPKPGVPLEFRGYGRAAAPVLPGGRVEHGHTVVTARRVTHCARGGAICLTQKWSSMGGVRDDFRLGSFSVSTNFRALQLWRAGPDARAAACGFVRLVNDSSSGITGLSLWVGEPTASLAAADNLGPQNCSTIVRNAFYLARNWAPLDTVHPDMPGGVWVLPSRTPQPDVASSGGGGSGGERHGDDEALSAAYAGVLAAAAVVGAATVAAIAYRHRRSRQTSTSPSSSDAGVVAWAGGATKRGSGSGGGDGDGSPAVASVVNPLATGGGGVTAPAAATTAPLAAL